MHHRGYHLLGRRQWIVSPAAGGPLAGAIATLSGIAKALTARGVPTPSGRGAWSPATVMRLDRRVQAA